MKICVVVASINELIKLNSFRKNLQEHGANVVVVDEGNETIRRRNEVILDDLDFKFYGPRERDAWFRQRFGNSYKKYLNVIPQKCHAETSFGFLIAYENDDEMIIEIDDDVLATDDMFIDEHMRNLDNEEGLTVMSPSRWYNTVENLLINSNSILYPRGHPYSPNARSTNYCWVKEKSSCILNMGLWTGQLDLDALTIFYHGGLSGKYSPEVKGLKRRRVVVGHKTYFAICSMNTAFRKEIIPAFYQLYMNQMGIDRFDDIWSGVLLKKIADHLGDEICLGEPFVYHDKRARNIFKDLRAEIEGMIINETLWRIVDEIEFTGKDYYECYSELSEGIEKSLGSFNENLHRKFIKLQIEKMKLWLDAIDRIG